MDDAELYLVYNSMQKQATERIVKEFVPQLQWRQNEQVLDVGCGPGDVTTQVLMPHLPPTAYLVGVDLSPKMIEFANKKNNDERVQFRTLDFGNKEVTNELHNSSFSKLFSFYCLHWINDQGQVGRNIYSLLCPGGEFLAIMAPSNQIYLVYKVLSQMDKWKSYMQDVNDFIPQFNGSKNPCEEIRKVMTKQGLDVIYCEERHESVTFESFEVLMRSNEAVNPFVKRMDRSTRQQYMASFAQVIQDYQMCTELPSGKVQTNNPFVVVYGRKPLL